MNRIRPAVDGITMESGSCHLTRRCCGSWWRHRGGAAVGDGAMKASVAEEKAAGDSSDKKVRLKSGIESRETSEGRRPPSWRQRFRKQMRKL